MPNQHHTIPVEKRFWSKVDKRSDDDCWNWLAGKDDMGYGMFRRKVIGFLGHAQRAHRVAYELTYGSIPTDVVVMHTCDNPSCCNPTHLTLGSRTDNNRDRDQKGRQVAPRGVESSSAILSESDVREIRSLLARGDLSHSEIARRYGVSRPTITAIASGRIWKHLI